MVLRFLSECMQQLCLGNNAVLAYYSYRLCNMFLFGFYLLIVRLPDCILFFSPWTT